MGLKPHLKTPSDFINPLLEKRRIEPKAFEIFKKALEDYKNKINNQHDKQGEPELVTNALKPFFDKLSLLAESEQQSGRSGIDLALKKDETIKVIIEAKKKDSKEMIIKSDFNHKALHEAVLYYLREVNGGNNAITHIIITDFYKWFVFDAKDFEGLFFQNKKVKKIFEDHNDKTKTGDRTGDFYESLKKLLDPQETDPTNNKNIDYAYFDITAPTNQNELISLAKLLSADVLYKEFNPNDANSLNKEFYTELLYILGLEEVKDGGKKLITRATKPQHGSFYENIANKLTQYDKPTDFETIIKLIIIWTNRILFLKLLESQLVKWNANPSLKFLNTTKINDYDKLEMLFFEILAKLPSKRQHKEFDYIPYLNSSLFEVHHDEDALLKVSNLADDTTLTYYTRTVIKDENTNRKTGTVGALEYLFGFLDAYDFGSGSEGSCEIASESKTLINASVLGLIFEKINGYKDGSFYTPSFITMYMARESISKTVIQKFEEVYSIKVESIESLNAELLRHRIPIDEIAKLIDSITICDPAVGSGHFLVSALNELVYIKYQLGLYGIRGLHMSLANDELLIKLEGEWFECTKPRDFDTPNHKLQKLLFEEKQRIIENQLFGVDINPNSSSITKLRLWIELLKNSYYDQNHQLVTLPNIDINIKTGNSLISRFDLKDELKINNIKEEIKTYKQKVRDYKENLGTKKDVLSSIDSLKAKFRLTLKAEYKVQKELNEKLKNYVSDYGREDLNDELIIYVVKNKFGLHQSFDFAEKDTKKQTKLLAELQKLQSQIDEIEQGKIYEDAFEWRFEFPEVLDENGDFVGFDIVIGNPPYGVEFEAHEKGLFNATYQSVEYQLDAYALFMERATTVLNPHGKLNFIIPSTWLAQHYFKNLRKYMIERFQFDTLLLFKFDVFSEATVEASIFFGSKQIDKTSNINYQTIDSEVDFRNISYQTINQKTWAKNPDIGFNLQFDASTVEIISKIENISLSLEQTCEITNGIKPYETGKGTPIQTKKDVENRIYDAISKLDETYRQYIVGTNIQKYCVNPDETKWIKFGKNLAAPRTFDFSQTKIVVRQTGDAIIASIDNNHLLNLNVTTHLPTKKREFYQQVA